MPEINVEEVAFDMLSDYIAAGGDVEGADFEKFMKDAIADLQLQLDMQERRDG